MGKVRRRPFLLVLDVGTHKPMVAGSNTWWVVGIGVGVLNPAAARFFLPDFSTVLPWSFSFLQCFYLDIRLETSIMY